jgi:heat shock protein HslJ
MGNRPFAWILGFALASCAAAPPGPSAALSREALAGKRWVAEAAGDVDAAQRPRLEFMPDGRLAGYSGCNSLSGSWRIEGPALRLGALAMTKRACLGPAGDLEKRFLAAVNAKTRFSLEGARLVAEGEAGARMAFSAGA